MNGKPVFTVPVKTVLNLHSGFSEKLLCDGPTFSTGDSCSFSCSFCYVPDMFRKLDRVRILLAEHGLKFEDVVVRRGNPIETLRKQLTHATGKPKYTDLSDRRVIYSSPVVDVAANMDLVRETVAACRVILELTNWRIRLLSKSNLLHKIAETLVAEAGNGATRIIGWHGAVGPGDVRNRLIFGVSTGTLDEGLAKAFEEGTPLVSKRLKSLHWLQDNGFRTFGMVCPSLPMDGGYGDFAREATAAIRFEKCEHVWAEVLNVRGKSMDRTVAALRNAGFNKEADMLFAVSTDKAAWEEYNRATFLAHAEAYRNEPGKLRYLTYVTAATHDWWAERKSLGAVLLGSVATSV